MANKTVEIVLSVIEPIAEKLGYEILEVDFSKKQDGMNLEVTIDKDGGVDIDDCEKLHMAIDEPLDSADPTDGKPYVLSVSSPGLDRPIKTSRDFERNKGSEVAIKLFVKENGKKEFFGNLFAFDDEHVAIEQKGKIVSFDRKKVALISPVIKF